MRKIVRLFLSALQIQLFLSIVSLIIIVHWGLPLSYLAPLGNIIFSPFLTSFLLLSSLVFFFELLHIPNQWLIYALEYVTHTWSKIMSLADQSWIINLSKPSAFFTLCVIISTCALLQSKHLQTHIRRILASSMLLGGILFYLGYSRLPQHDVQTVSLGTKSLTILYAHGILCIIDNGALTQQACTKRWIECTLLPLLRKTYATDTVNHLIVLRPTVKAFQSIGEFCTSTTVKNVYVPYWDGDTPKNLARAYFTARQNLEKQGTLHRLGKKTIHITLNTTSSLALLPQEQHNTYRTIRFPDIKIRYILANKILGEVYG